MRKFLKKLKSVSFRDYANIILFFLAIIPACFLKRKRKNLWLVCEYGQEARDNGYWFFRYMREQHPEQDIVYAIDFQSKDYEKVKNIGECVPYGTFKHWIYYLCAEVNISSHKGGKPNAAVCYFLEIYGFLKNKRVFLQHGITKDLAEIFFYQNTKMRLFICGAKPEYEFVRKEFGYPKGYVQYTGFARFDNLRKTCSVKKQILVAPTWRSWLYKVSSNPYENKCSDAVNSEYVEKWLTFLKSEQLEILLKENDYELVFFPHRNMTSVFESLMVAGKRVHIANWKEADLQILMKESMAMITDYSSTAMDFAYMEKPVIYYQFDYERYRREQFAEGYFDYERDGFGEVVREQEQLLIELSELLNRRCTIEKKYQERIKEFFPLRDTANCERIYEQVRKVAYGRTDD